jgi:hypothetical protein
MGALKYPLNRLNLAPANKSGFFFLATLPLVIYGYDICHNVHPASLFIDFFYTCIIALAPGSVNLT